MPEVTAIALPARPGFYSQALTLGDFYLIIALSGNPDDVTIELGKNTVNKLTEIIDQTPELTTQSLLSLISDHLNEGIHLDFVAAKISSTKLTASGKGAVEARLLRKYQIINLFPNKSETKNVSGPVMADDILILGTSDFFKVISPNDLNQLSSQDLAAWRDDCFAKIESQNGHGSQAALVVKITQASEPVTALTYDFPVKRFSPKNLFLRGFNKEAVINFGSQRKNLYLALIVLVTLVSLVTFQLRSRSLENRANQVRSLEAQARQGLDSAGKLTGLNDAMARQILVQTKKDFLSQAEATFGQNWQKNSDAQTQHLTGVLSELDKQITAVMHIHPVDKLEIFYDFALLKADPTIVSASLNSGEMVAFDNHNGSFYSLGIKNKTAAIVGGGDQFKREGLVDFAGSNVYVETSEGIFSMTRGGAVKQLFKPSDQWGKIKGLKAFAGNLYLLDTDKSQIWKYQGTDLGFADLSPYLKAGSVDFSKVVSFNIDGYVYVLSASGNLDRFASGSPDIEFTVAGLDKPFSNPASLYTAENTQGVYVLDKGNNRVVVLDKKGAYLAQYLLPTTNYQLPTILLVDEEAKKVLLVSGPKVYYFDLK